MRKKSVSQKWRNEGGGRAGEEREVCIHVGGNRGIFSSSHTRREGERDGAREDASHRERKRENESGEDDRGIQEKG